MTMQFYRVGGCVRDALLRSLGYDIPQGDRDWVVVGATPQKMVDLGFRPVGADFPVFLHPKTHEEYALARTERKTAHGYHGFQFYTSAGVTLVEDLKRRDLTINAIAQDDSDTLIDPYHGLEDLKNKVLRHVSLAFAEDPVRILRTARFAATFPDFRIAPETLRLMTEMVENGEADALVAERVWQEISRGLTQRAPWRMIATLNDCGLWKKLCPETTFEDIDVAALDRAAQSHADCAICAALIWGQIDNEERARVRLHALRAPSIVTELTTLTVRLSQRTLSLSQSPNSASLTDLFFLADVLRRPERFDAFLEMLRFRHPNFDATLIRQAALAFCSVDAGAVARGQKNATDIATALRKARQDAVAQICPN